MLSVIVLLLSLFGIATCTDIATFDDRKCSASLESINGPNGYPNGTCTQLNIKTTQSFQIVGLDKGCAVTLYGPDTTSDPCSAEILIVGRLATCYNSTWNYYSIDGCDVPSLTPSATPLPQSSSTSLPSSSSFSSSISTASIASVSASQSSSPPLSAEKSNHLPLIVGASLGGVGVIALITIAVLLLVRRRRSKPHEPRTQPPSYELSNDRALVEANGSRSAEKTVQTELWAHDSIPAQEMGRSSTDMPRAELAGDSLVGQDKKNIDPLIKMHMER